MQLTCLKKKKPFNIIGIYAYLCVIANRYAWHELSFLHIFIIYLLWNAEEYFEIKLLIVNA